MRDGMFENQNIVARCGTGVLKKIWGCPGAGNTQRKIKMGEMDDFKPNEKYKWQKSAILGVFKIEWR